MHMQEIRDIKLQMSKDWQPQAFYCVKAVYLFFI